MPWVFALLDHHVLPIYAQNKWAFSTPKRKDSATSQYCGEIENAKPLEIFQLKSPPPTLSPSPTLFPHGWNFPGDFGKLIDWTTMCVFSFEFYLVIHDVVDNWAISNEATLISNKLGFEPMFELMRTQFTNAYMALISLPMGVPLYIALYAFRQCYHEAVSASSHFWFTLSQHIMQVFVNFLIWTYNSIVWYSLTHCGRVTHICVVKLTTIGSDDGLSPGRRQAII